MTPEIRVGLIGCGRIARLVHMNALGRIRGARLTAVSDTDEKRRVEAGRACPGARVYSDYRELLTDGGVDAVIICLPNFLHSEAAVQAFGRGKHVYLEKPLACNSVEGKSVLAAWKKSGAKGMIGHNLRFSPLYQALKAKIRSGIIGNILCVRTVFSSAPRTLPEWKRKRETGGGVTLDLASHHTDLIRYLFDTEIAQVFARIGSENSEHDNALVGMRTESGVEVQSFFSLNSVDEDKVEVYGAMGRLAVDRYRSLNVEIISGDGRKTGGLGGLTESLFSILRSPVLRDRVLRTGREPSFESALVHFTGSIIDDTPPSPDLSDGFISLSVIEAAEESARTGRVITPGDGKTAGTEEINA